MRPRVAISTLAAVVGLVGCTVGPLAEVAIVRAPDSGREAIVREQVALFVDAVAPHEVFVDRIVFVDTSRRDWRGRWSAGSGTIHLERTLVGANLVRSIRHELCHALDTAHGDFWRDSPALFRRLVAWPRFRHGCDEGDVGCQRREAFAQVCEDGPWAAQALRHDCLPRNQLMLEAMQHQVEAVWLGALPIEAGLGHTMGRVDLGTGVRVQHVESTAMSHLLALTLAFEGDPRPHERVLDLDTEDLFASEAKLGPAPLAAPPPWHAHARYDQVEPRLGVPGGPSVADVRLRTRLFGPRFRRIWSDGREWGLLGDGCAIGEPELVTGDQHVLAVSDTPDGMGVQWRRIGWVAHEAGVDPR